MVGRSGVPKPNMDPIVDPSRSMSWYPFDASTRFFRLHLVRWVIEIPSCKLPHDLTARELDDGK